MDMKELQKLLVESIENNRGKYVPWWQDDFEHCMYRYNIFTEEEIEKVIQCVNGCKNEEITANIGAMGLTLFHLLVWHNFYEAVEKILNDGVDINIQAAEGKGILKETCIGATPLMLACYRGNFKMVKLLKEKGADMVLKDAKGRNAYHYLCGYIKNLPIDYECQKNSIDDKTKIAMLLSEGINEKDEDGMTPLETVISRDNTNLSYALTKAFLDKGAETDGVYENGDSLLILAVRKNHMTASLQLAAKKELINKQNNDGKTPLHFAAERENLELCMALTGMGADKNMPDNAGNTAGDMAKDSYDEELGIYLSTGRLPIATLSRLTANAFAGYSDDNRDRITLALYMAEKLVKEADTDDDDDMKQITSVLHNALMLDEKCQVLDIYKKAGIDFTVPIHTGGSVTCMRDECFGGSYGVKVIEKFIELGVDINDAVIKGRTPANIVASSQKRMMFNGKKDDYFEKAAEYFSVEAMEQVDNNGTTAMHQAAKYGHADMINVMAQKGANINVTEDEPADAGSTPLHVASSYGNADVVRVLIKSGADDTMQNTQGETPAHLAVMKKKFGGELGCEQRTEVLEALCNIDIARNDGKTPIMLLQYLDINTNISILPMLIDRGADVNHIDNDGNSALILNAKNQCYKGAVKELVRAGADVNQADRLGNNALYYALKYGDQESARFLIKKGADYNHANNDGVTPVQIAVEKGYDTVLELMTE